MLIYNDFCTGTYPKFGQYYTHGSDYQMPYNQSRVFCVRTRTTLTNTCECPVRNVEEKKNLCFELLEETEKKLKIFFFFGQIQFVYADVCGDAINR